jgi:hypothetical protein
VVDEVVVLVRRHLPQFGDGAFLDEDDLAVVVPVPDRDDRWRLTLGGLIDDVRHSPRAEWPAQVAEWFDQRRHALAELVADAESTEPGRTAFDPDALRVQVWPRGVREWPDGIEHWLAWPLHEVFELAVVLDHPGAVEFLSVERALAGDLDIDGIVSRAMRQTYGEEIVGLDVRDHPMAHESWPPLRVLASDRSPYVSAALLWIGQYVTGEAPFGALVAAPGKGAVCLYEVSSRTALDAAPSVARIVRSAHAATDDPLDPNLYWWVDGRFHLVGYDEAGAGAEAVTFPEELRSLIESLPEQ